MYALMCTIFSSIPCAHFYIKMWPKTGPHSSFPSRLTITCSLFSASLSTILIPTYIFSHIPITQLKGAVNTDVPWWCSAHWAASHKDMHLDLKNNSGGRRNHDSHHSQTSSFRNTVKILEHICENIRLDIPCGYHNAQNYSHPLLLFCF